MNFMLKIDYFQKQGDFSGNRDTGDCLQNRELLCQKEGLAALV